MKILAQSKHVTAVEMDPRMAAEVIKRVQGTYAPFQVFSPSASDLICFVQVRSKKS